MSTREQLLKEIDRFLQATGMTSTMFGVKAVGDRAFMIRLREGREPTTRTVDRIRSFMKENGRRPTRRAEARAA